MGVWVCGDTHGDMDIKKLKKFKDTKEAEWTKNDFVIIAGDFGLLWKNEKDAEEERLINFYRALPWTTLFVDGNHENHDRLERLEEVDMFGDKVGKVTEGIYHLKRGRIYEIDGKKIFTFGGGYSIDKLHRVEFLSWWRQELPIYSEYMFGLNNLIEADYKVDYIITHSCPRETFDVLNDMEALYHKDVTEELGLQKYFDMIVKWVEFKGWFFGHFHQDVDIDGKFHAMYKQLPRKLV